MEDQEVNSDPPDGEPFLGDTVYFYVMVAGFGVFLLGALGVAGSASMGSDAASEALGIVCCCLGVAFGLEMWLAWNIVKNRAWAFYVSLIFLLIGCLLPYVRSSSRPPAISASHDLQLFKILGWLLSGYRVVYILARVSELIGPKPN